MALTKVRNVIDVTADTMADLLTMKHKKGSVQLLGFHERGDGGGGVFYWDADESTANHNGGTIIAGNKDVSEATWGVEGAGTWFDAPAVTTGCWKREFSGAVNVKWFGAKGDWAAGVGGTDNTNIFHKAFFVCMTYFEGRTLYIPSGHYKCSELEIDFPDHGNPAVQVQGFIIKGDGGIDQRTSSTFGRGHSTIVYEGTLGTALTTTGQINSGMQFKDLVIKGTGGSYSIENAVLEGTTAKGLSLNYSINHKLDNVNITGFDIGLHIAHGYVSQHTSCRFVQNNIGAHYDSATNAITSTGVSYRDNHKVGVLLSPRLTGNTIRDVLFSNPTVESCPIGFCIDSVLSEVRAIKIDMPYFENNNVLFKIGYSETGVPSLLKANGITVTSTNYNGPTPSSIFDLNMVTGVFIKHLGIDYQMQDAIKVTDSVRNVQLDTHQFGNGVDLPFLPNAFKNKLQRATPYNLIAGGNYLVHDGAFIYEAPLARTITFEDGAPVLNLTLPNTWKIYLFFPLHNIDNIKGQRLQFSAAIQSPTGVATTVGLYDTTGTFIGPFLSSFPTTEIGIKKASLTIGDSILGAECRVQMHNTSGAAQVIKIKSISLTTDDSGPIVTDAMDVLTSMSGTATCSPTAVVNVPSQTLFGRKDYRVIVTPHSNVTCYVTKTNTNFTITCSGNSDVDYIILPLGRVFA